MHSDSIFKGPLKNLCLSFVAFDILTRMCSKFKCSILGSLFFTQENNQAHCKTNYSSQSVFMSLQQSLSYLRIPYIFVYALLSLSIHSLCANKLLESQCNFCSFTIVFFQRSLHKQDFATYLKIHLFVPVPIWMKVLFTYLLHHRLSD